MSDFLSPAWRGPLAARGLDNFDVLWSLQAPWFDEPNHARGGWSGVSRIEIASPAGMENVFFLKRQENYSILSWRHPLKGIPTLLREFRLILRYRAAGIATVDPVYFAMRPTKAGYRAILMTVALDGFVPLDTYVADRVTAGHPTPTERRRVLAAVADLTRHIHDCRIQHNSYYPKHVFVRVGPDGAVKARVIDLERSRWRPLTVFCTLRDLDTLNRHSSGWSCTDRLWFFKAYLGIGRLTPYAKWLWRDVESRSLKKDRLQIPARHLAVPRGGTT